MLETADIVAIKQLYAFYCHVCDSGQWEHLDEVYTPDVLVDRTAYGYELSHGPDAVRTSFHEMPLPPSHQASTIYVYEEDGEVRAKAKMFFAGPNDQFLTSDVDDVLVRTPGGWRVSRRVFTPRGSLTTFKDKPFTFDEDQPK